MPQAARTEKRETYHRFMDAAENIFIRYGYEGASIRMISREADAPLGTLHHYWGSKEVLFRDTCERRFGPIIAQQEARLADCGRRMDAGEQLEVQTLVRALIEPPLLADGKTGVGAECDIIRLFYGRVLTEPSEVVKRIVRELLNAPAVRFHALMRRRHAHLDEPTFYWRCTCAIGAFVFAQSFGDRMAYVEGRSLEAVSWPFVVDEIVGFIVRGMGSGAA